MRKGLENFLLAFLILLLPVSFKVFSYGIFLDGLTYASISRNMAEGVGTPFKPAYTLSFGNPSYGHLPLAFWIEALFFKIFGDIPLLERYISISFGIMSLILLAVWVHLLNGKVKWSWIILLVAMPIFPWAISNNILEVFILFWTSLSLVFLTLAFKRGSVWAIFGGFFIFCSFMTKGPVGLFVLVYPFLYGFIYDKRFHKVFNVYTLVILGFLIPFLALLMFKDFRVLLEHYFKGQIIAGVVGKRERAPERWYIILRLIRELMPILVLLILRLYKSNNVVLSRNFWLYIILALSSSFPFLISIKQIPFYIVPSLPFFALAFSELMKLDGFEKLFDKMKPRYKFALILTLTLLNILLAYNSYGKIRSKNPFYTDLVINPPSVEKIHRKVGICPDNLFSDWETVAIAQRYLKWTFVFGWQKYTLVDIERCKSIPANCKKIHPKNPRRFSLYKCNKR